MYQQLARLIKDQCVFVTFGLVLFLCSLGLGCGSGGTLQSNSGCEGGGSGCQSAPLPTSTLTAQPTAINSGQSSILSWSTQNGTTVDLQPGIGHVQVKGSLRISPTKTTTYTLTVTGKGGTSKTSATVKVGSGTQPSGVQLSPGDDVQAAVKSKPAGTTFTLAPGVYRMQSVVPKDHDVFSGQKGATLVGAALIEPSSWKQASSSVWVAQVSGITPESSYRGECDKNHPACMYPEDMFFDSKPLMRVASLSLVAPGKWFLDYSTDKAYVGSDPAGHTVEVSVTHAAFWGSASNVTIRGLTIEKYASIAGKGAINAMGSLDGYGPAADNWTVDSNELLLNHGAGVRVNNGMVVANNKIHNNGQMGIGGNGDQILMKNNEVYNNNYVGYSYDWEAGGIKVASSATHVTIEGNYVHDNKGPGIHADISCDHITIQNNHTLHNLAIGIHYEISYNGVIKNNLVEDDGILNNPAAATPWYGGGIIVSNSVNVDVSGNTVTHCSNGIFGTYADRGSDAKTGLPYTLKNLNVHDNTVTQQAGSAAGIMKSDIFDGSVYTIWSNHFQNNTFYLSALTHPYFVWLGELWTYAQWNEYASEH
jgi:parallel beta helix pectate lyase-like protein